MSFARISDRLTALMAPRGSIFATTSAPASFCSKANTAEASSTTMPLLNARLLMPLADQLAGQTGVFPYMAPNKFSRSFDGPMEGSDPQLTVRDTQNNFGSRLEAQLTANFGGDDNPSALGHFRAKRCHEKPDMPLLEKLPCYSMNGKFW